MQVDGDGPCSVAPECSTAGDRSAGSVRPGLGLSGSSGDGERLDVALPAVQTATVAPSRPARSFQETARALSHSRRRGSACFGRRVTTRRPPRTGMLFGDTRPSSPARAQEVGFQHNGMFRHCATFTEDVRDRLRQFLCCRPPCRAVSGTYERWSRWRRASASKRVGAPGWDRCHACWRTSTSSRWIAANRRSCSLVPAWSSD